ncbi:hypothetical protein FQA47_005714 [Oryzias melastigma]|uniref:Uncharacterized protein n=1 Tax=Oryzias melastigma TaxID=30732 RepID=A0A834BPN1_ORYME|nr:hypothetical protein FQA47_005714 [Oryzias melastigma]
MVNSRAEEGTWPNPEEGSGERGRQPEAPRRARTTAHACTSTATPSTRDRIDQTRESARRLGKDGRQQTEVKGDEGNILIVCGDGIKTRD